MLCILFIYYIINYNQLTVTNSDILTLLNVTKIIILFFLWLFVYCKAGVCPRIEA